MIKIKHFSDAIKHVNIFRSTNNSKINPGEKTPPTTTKIINHKMHFLEEGTLICLNRLIIARK